ncbi:Hypothetical predicted protein, partial [Olea europaea subsp. europaea]
AQEEEPIPGQGEQGHWFSKEEAERKGIKRPIRQINIKDTVQSYIRRCEEISTSISVRMSKGEYNHASREKRQAGFIAGLLISDAISYFRQKWFGNVSDDPSKLKAYINQGFHQLKKKNDLISVALRVTSENQRKLANQINALNTVVTQLPSLEMFSEHILNNLEEFLDHIDTLIISVQQENMDHVIFEKLFQTKKLEGIESRDIQIRKMDLLAPSTLKFYLHGQQRSNHAKIYQVKALSFFSNLTGIPIRNDYVGKSVILHNTTSNCVSAIDSSSSRYITEECAIKNFKDPTLRLWRQTTLPKFKQETKHSQSINAWPHILIYCYGNRIGLNGQSGMEWTDCPTYAFRLNYTQTFRTSDNLVVHQAKLKETIKEFSTTVVLDVHDIHFEDYLQAHEQINEHIDLVANLTETALKNIAFTVEDTQVTWRDTTWSILGFIMTIIIIMVVYKMYLTIKQCAFIPPRHTAFEMDNLQSQIQKQVNDQVQQEVNARLNRMIMAADKRKRRTSDFVIKELDEQSML